VNVLLADLYLILDLDDKDKEKDLEKKSPSVRFPLNQLTWPELARMIVLSSVLTGKGLNVKVTVRDKVRVNSSLIHNRNPNTNPDPN
jgi:hypothetical protein